MCDFFIFFMNFQVTEQRWKGNNDSRPKPSRSRDLRGRTLVVRLLEGGARYLWIWIISGMLCSSASGWKTRDGTSQRDDFVLVKNATNLLEGVAI
jgi:hypothetical protein